MNDKTFAIVGASLAGATAAIELRERGFDGRVVVIGDEPELPYERPALSKDYLRGESEREQLLVKEESYYAEQEIELLLGHAVSEIDLDRRRLALERRDADVAFDALLLATGARPRRLEVPGSELDGIHYLRTVSDSDTIRRRLDHGGRLAVVGGGFIGCEIAASARQRGLEVTLVSDQKLPMQMLGDELGEFYRRVHNEHGVELVLADGLQRFEGDGSTVRRAVTESGRAIECDFVVVGAGAVPNAELAQSAGLETSAGVLVDERLAASAPGVWAAGDVANHQHPLYGGRVRVEHWANAQRQGRAAAASMLGDKSPYSDVPYFFSDQYDVGMEYAGLARPGDRVVFRGDPEGGEFIAFWLRDGVLTAGMNVNVWDVSDQIQKLIAERKQLDVARLTDPDTPLESLL